MLTQAEAEALTREFGVANRTELLRNGYSLGLAVLAIMVAALVLVLTVI